jgi:hypothetical protein
MTANDFMYARTQDLVGQVPQNQCVHEIPPDWRFHVLRLQYAKTNRVYLSNASGKLQRGSADSSKNRKWADRRRDYHWKRVKEMNESAWNALCIDFSWIAAKGFM